MAGVEGLAQPGVCTGFGDTASLSLLCGHGDGGRAEGQAVWWQGQQRSQKSLLLGLVLILSLEHKKHGNGCRRLVGVGVFEFGR